MLRLARLLITAVAFAACVVVSLAAAVTVFRQGLDGATAPEELLPAGWAVVPGPPPPLPGDRELAMLVSQDLSRSPRDEQLALAAQIEHFLRTRRDGRPPLGPDLAPEKLARLQENLIAVARVWILAKADQFAGLRASQRGAYLDDLLTPIDSLEAMARSMARPTHGAKGRPSVRIDAKARASGGPALMTLLARLQEGTTAEEQNKASNLLYALIERHQLRGKQSAKTPRVAP